MIDHSKIAMIDAMMRQGLPPVDPAFGAAGPHGQLFYYYLWHYSAAELALPLHVSGWEADIALTWFTAFASLSLLMGVAVWLSKQSMAAIWVVGLAAAASLRTVLSWIFGTYALEPFLAPPTGFAGWLFQAAWAPQHLMSASCVVAAMLLVARYAQRQSALLLLALVLVVVAGFESSTYVGGITFAIAALVCGSGADRRNRAGAALAVFWPGWRSPSCWCSASPHRSCTIRSWPWPRAVATTRSSFVILRCWARCFRRRFAAHWIGRPIGSCCCRSSFRRSISRAASLSSPCCATPR